MSTQKLIESAAGLKAHLKERYLQKALSFADCIEEHIEYPRSDAAQKRASIMAAAEAFRQRAKTGEVPPCEDATLKELKSLPKNWLPKHILSEDELDTSIGLWCQVAPCDKTVKSVNWNPQTHKIEVKLNTSDRRLAAYTQTQLNCDLKPADTCCLLPPWWPDFGFEVSMSPSK